MGSAQLQISVAQDDGSVYIILDADVSGLVPGTEENFSTGLMGSVSGWALVVWIHAEREGGETCSSLPRSSNSIICLATCRIEKWQPNAERVQILM